MRIGAIDFPGGPVVKTLCFDAGGPGSITGQGTRTQMVTNGVVKTSYICHR